MTDGSTAQFLQGAFTFTGQGPKRAAPPDASLR